MHTHTHTQCTCWQDNDGENVCRADERQKFVSLSNLAGNKRSVVRGGGINDVVIFVNADSLWKLLCAFGCADVQRD